MLAARSVVILLALPLAGLALLLAVPALDARWEHQPSHFWLVTIVAGLNAILGLATAEAASRRGDTRTFLMSMALLVSAGFLALHALATPGVLVEGPNAGFTIATPVGLVLASVLAAASVVERREAPGIGRRAQRRLRASLLLVLVAWAVASLAELPLLAEPLDEEVPLALRIVAPVALGLDGWAAVRYLALYRERRRPLLLAIAVALILLAEAMIAIVFSRTWHATWWEWHVLMAIAFAAIFLAARAEYRRAGSVTEAFTGLYLERTIRLVDEQTSAALQALSTALREGTPLEPIRERLRDQGLTGERIAALERSASELRRVDGLLHSYVGPQLATQLSERPELAGLGGRSVEVTVLFADLVGFTSYSEVRPPEEGMTLLNTYWAAVVPAIVDRFGGLIERFAGDGILVLFNSLGDQPDHALRAVNAATFVQRTIGELAAMHADWPLFRIGINTGAAVVGNVGADQQRAFTVIGDTANTAARFEALAAPGRIVIGRATYELVRDEVATTPLGPVALKGKREPHEVFEVDLSPP